MNYIELINNFWKLDDSWQFSCPETRLYFYLVKTANGLGWENSFIHGDDKTSANVGVSKGTLKTSRNRLSQAGLISFKEGGKGHANKTRYHILTPKPQPNHAPKPQPKAEPKPTPLLIKQKETKLNILILDGEEKVLSESLFNLLEEILSNENYLHMMYKNSPIRDLNEIKTYLKKFFVELEMRGDTYKTTEDAIQHFSSWLKIELEKNVKQKGGVNANRADSKKKRERNYDEAM